jgi:hypothetical protein
MSEEHPEISLPREIWILINRATGNPVEAEEGMSGVFYAADNERDAWFAAAYQAREYDVDCVPVRFAPGGQP